MYYLYTIYKHVYSPVGPNQLHADRAACVSEWYI